MARTIGKANIHLVKDLTLKALKKHTTPWGDTEYAEIEEEVVEQLPSEMWDTWEMSDQEIRRIINDVMTEWSVRKN